MLEELKAGSRVVGAKQTRRAPEGRTCEKGLHGQGRRPQAPPAAGAGGGAAARPPHPGGHHAPAGEACGISVGAAIVAAV